MCRVFGAQDFAKIMNIAVVLAFFFLYGFVFLLGLIGILNVISAEIFHIRMRAREFAVLQTARRHDHCVAHEVLRAEDTAHPVSDALGDDRRGDGSIICSDLGDGAHIAACAERPEPDRNDPDAEIGGTPACAEPNAWIDGNTPEELTNRVTTTSGEIIWPSVVTDFHATDLTALVPITPMNVVDMETGANISQYADAASHVYIANNREYGQLAKSALDSARWAVGAQMGPSFTMNLFLYEGGVYKPRESTIQEMDFVMEIPKKLRDISRWFS